jgi:hypothetical protein
VARWLGQGYSFLKRSTPAAIQGIGEKDRLGVAMEAERWGRGVVWVLVLVGLRVREGERDVARLPKIFAKIVSLASLLFVQVQTTKTGTVAAA